MINLELYSLAMKLGLGRYDIDKILKGKIINSNTSESSISGTTVDLYKNGTHYGTISIKDFIIL